MAGVCDIEKMISGKGEVHLGNSTLRKGSLLGNDD